VEATKRLAWHLLHIRKLEPATAEMELCRWVYETGARTSNDVQRDIAAGTAQVAQQTRDIVHWCARQPVVTKRSSPPSFVASEVEAVVDRVRAAPHGEPDHIEFGLRMLEFAKAHGVRQTDGWEFQISIRGVVRTWPKCSGMRYKPFMDQAIESGLLVKTREKLQSSDGTGRPRTYRIQVPTGIESCVSMTLADAVAYGHRASEARRNRLRDTERNSDESDTYQNVSPSPPRTLGETQEAAAQGSTESVACEGESAAASTADSLASKASLASPDSLEGHSHVGHISDRVASDGPVGNAQFTANCTRTVSERQHPPCPGTRLADGSAERPRIGTPVPGLPDRTPGSLPADPAGTVQRLMQRYRPLPLADHHLQSSGSAPSFRNREQARLATLSGSLGGSPDSAPPPSPPVCHSHPIPSSRQPPF
jgi:hypothetical protein